MFSPVLVLSVKDVNKIFLTHLRWYPQDSKDFVDMGEYLHNVNLSIVIEFSYSGPFANKK